MNKEQYSKVRVNISDPTINKTTRTPIDTQIKACVSKPLRYGVRRIQDHIFLRTTARMIFSRSLPLILYKERFSFNKL
jgi:hypothetical protein